MTEETVTVSLKRYKELEKCEDLVLSKNKYLYSFRSGAYLCSIEESDLVQELTKANMDLGKSIKEFTGRENLIYREAESRFKKMSIINFIKWKMQNR